MSEIGKSIAKKTTLKLENSGFDISNLPVGRSPARLGATKAPVLARLRKQAVRMRPVPPGAGKHLGQASPAICRRFAQLGESAGSGESAVFASRFFVLEGKEWRNAGSGRPDAARPDGADGSRPPTGERTRSRRPGECLAKARHSRIPPSPHPRFSVPGDSGNTWASAPAERSEAARLADSRAKRTHCIPGVPG